MDRNPELAIADARPSQDGRAAPSRLDDAQLAELASRIKAWGRELGFGAIGISDTDLSEAEAGLAAWLEAGCHGEMDYMAKHGMKRARPAELVAGTRRVISARLAYLPAGTLDGAPDAQGARRDWRAREAARIADPQAAVVSVYARGRDYHKVLRNRLQTLAERIEAEIGAFGHRVFTDSAPVLEVELAQKAGVGWRGKHTLLLQRDAGSFFFLGEIYVDVPLPADAQTSPDAAPETPGAHCGSCTRCLGACPTGAIVAPYRVDARRCISYLTIELHGSIPEPLRPLIGNRVYGCDDCQLVCPWNKFAQAAPVADFDVRHGLDRASLVELFEWTAEQFDERMQGSAIRRIGYERWLRNLAVGLGNALRAAPGGIGPDARAAIVAALRARLDDPCVSALVREHVEWALRAA
ncbi:iron-sulfur cluster binding protein [Burkholderia pseudomallei]|uniref:Epoxyqueuosine reductase n=2 Tax=Burkholderia pseudomallei TaxID=28450 RepID=QUEG_BURPS|nr:tRNA epoxyqueuosine(34) reductase QueG [Burkholderia pseudomallei]Q63WN0.1 RecName: Full=Epoxyqueuosine reductase; AltName: Full=Queuosine biosynthesis protein QueG [Burkholderia pseudomallei K96243]KGW50147.1 epoxyqueuosine reductase [Burkholderia pseudomallei MSHR684]AFI67277.1 iron-sulfur cluster-binding protein [Burkholderia pseudomallei 1026b]AHE26307.1 putative iron-sulfur cluster-binding protein [Burkholderia pseudomallei NCTC 13178]AHE32248.1 putative iron-sulfur cluster-binding pro